MEKLGSACPSPTVGSHQEGQTPESRFACLPTLAPGSRASQPRDKLELNNSNFSTSRTQPSITEILCARGEMRGHWSLHVHVLRAQGGLQEVRTNTLLAASPADFTNHSPSGSCNAESFLPANLQKKWSPRAFMKSIQNNFFLNTEVPVDERTYPSWLGRLLVSGIPLRSLTCFL